MVDALNVYLHDTLVGRLTPDRLNRKRIQFEVDEDYVGPANALSEAISLIKGRVTDKETASQFFGGFLPEGPNRTALATRVPGLNADNLFGILSNYGLTMAGAVSVRSDDPREDVTAAYRELNPRELRKKLQKAVKDHDLGSEPESGRSAIAGFQPKVLLARFEGQWYQPLFSAHSTHIVKPAPAHRPVTISDEFYSHEISRHMGLASFGSELVELNGLRYLAIERYDRRVRGFGEVDVFHQEDAAQILGLDWTDTHAKFQDPEHVGRRDRPTAARIAEIAGTLTVPDGTEIWLKYLIYTVLIGNHDSHAKNVSIVHDGDESRLADLYDAVPILHINDEPDRAKEDRITDQMALAVNGEFSHHSISRAHIEAEATSWGAIAMRRIATLIDETFDQFAYALDAVLLPESSTPHLKDRLGHNLERLSSGLTIQRLKTAVAPWGGPSGSGSQVRRGQTGKSGNTGKFDVKPQSPPEVRL